MSAEDPAGQTVRKPAARRLSGFSFARQWRLTRKELAETLRDRRTIVTLVLMPVLVYPLLSILFRQFLTSSLGNTTHTVALIGVDDRDNNPVAGGMPFADKLQLWLNAGQELVEQKQLAEIEPPLVPEPDFKSIRLVKGNSEELLHNGDVDVVVRRISPVDANSRPIVEVIYPERSTAATSLRSFIERRVRALNLAAEEKTAQADDAPFHLTLRHKPISAGAAPQSLLPSVVPLVLLLMTITGAVYPAIDLTAGERERGTLEALIAAPVSRVGVLMAKYVAVVAVSLLTAGMNLIAMSITIYSSGLANVLVVPGQNVPLLFLQVFGLLLLFSGFFSALLLVVTSFARSFKEAQAYLIPLMLVTLAPGLMSLSPTLKLNGFLAVVPLVNVVLLARDVFSGAVDSLTTVIVIVSTALYAAVSIALAARIFGSDAILYGSEGSWTDLFRRPVKPSPAPRLVTALLCLALVFAAIINLGGAGALLAAEFGPAAQLIVNASSTCLVFAFIPLLASTLENVPWFAAFRMRSAKMRFWLAAVLLGFSLGVLVFELTVLGLQWELTTISKTLEEAIQKKAEELNTLPIGLILLTLAVVPAVAEELFFRGYLFRALETRFRSSASITVTALCFALFHTAGANGITVERLMPSLLLGLALGLLAQRSGSVWPGILLHSINNSLLLTVARFHDMLIEKNLLPAGTKHVPGLWLAIAAGLATVGFLLIVAGRSQQQPPDRIADGPVET